MENLSKGTLIQIVTIQFQKPNIYSYAIILEKLENHWFLDIPQYLVRDIATKEINTALSMHITRAGIKPIKNLIKGLK